MAWHTICLPRKRGGLAVPNLKLMKTTLLSKISWKLANPQDTVAATILKAKYGGWSALFTSQLTSNCSALCPGIMKSASWVVQGTQWEVGDGTSALFWSDRWLMQEPLHQFAIIDIPSDLRLLPIRHYWQQVGGWQVEALAHFLPGSILTIQLYPAGEHEDVPRWTLTNQGKFTVRSLHNLMQPWYDSLINNIWSRIWQFHGPGRASMTLWMIMHRGLLTT